MCRIGCLLLALFFFTTVAQAADLRSPLPVRNLYPPMMRFFDPTPDSALRSFDQPWLFELTQHYSTVNNAKGAGWRGSSQAEFGNIELSDRLQLLKGKTWALAALAAVKLPTASKARGWGSGAVDLAVGGVVSCHQGDGFAYLEGWLVQPLARDEPGNNAGYFCCYRFKLAC